MGKHTVVAVDVAKAVFELAVSEEPGRIKLHRRLSRGEFEIFLVQIPRATVVMEACGSAYLRVLLVHGARSVLCHAQKATTHDRALKLQSRSRHNKAAVALANKLARIAWAVWRKGREYESVAPAA